MKHRGDQGLPEFWRGAGHAEVAQRRKARLLDGFSTPEAVP